MFQVIAKLKINLIILSILHVYFLVSRNPQRKYSMCQGLQMFCTLNVRLIKYPRHYQPNPVSFYSESNTFFDLSIKESQ